jgi:hypothetical protein
MVFLLFVFQPKIFAQEIETLIPADDDISRLENGRGARKCLKATTSLN